MSEIEQELQALQDIRKMMEKAVASSASADGAVSPQDSLPWQAHVLPTSGSRIISQTGALTTVARIA